MTDVLARTLVLSQAVSPLPTGGWWHSARDDDDSAVTLVAGGAVRWDGGGFQTREYGAHYPTTRKAFREAWEAEVSRVHRLVEPLACSFIFVGRKFPPLSRPNVTNLDEIPEREPPASRAGPTNRFLDVLEAAVEATGKDPNPSGRETIDLDHWCRVTSDHFAYVLDGAPHVALLTDRPFVGVFTEWLRQRDAEEGHRRRVLRAIAAFPTDPAEVPSFVADVLRIAGRLTAVLPRAGLDFYRAAVAAVDLAEPDGRPATTPCEVLFMEQAGKGVFLTPVLGLDVPNPRGGYALRLRDNSGVRLSQPPWRMGIEMGCDNQDGGEPYS